MPILDVDGNGIAKPFSDGLLIMRYFIGYRGDDLINSIVDPDATRTTAVEIEGYIAGIWNYLDADGDGNVTFCDCRLILHYLIGLTGENLTSSVLAAGAARTPEQIAEYLDSISA